MIEGAGGISISAGDVLGEFVIEEVVGHGGMGVVFRARQRRPDRLVALKVIGPELAGQSAFEARFAREAAIAAQIEHPNVIPVYAVGEDRGLLYIAMRLIEGTDLRTLLVAEHRLEPRRAARLVEQVAQALDAAHAHGLVHRDVKPANILIARVGGGEHAYLTDFGIARAVESGATMTGTGALLGTVDYIAPEQARGDRIDARADVYSLGCVLFQAVSGTVPYPLGSSVAKLFAHAHEPPPSLLERMEEVPPELGAVVARAMAKLPQERYQSAGELGRAAVAGASGVLTQVAREVSASPPPTPHRRGRRRGKLLAVVIGLGVIAAVAIALIGGGSASPHRCGEISFAHGSTLESSDYGVGNIVATGTTCETARRVAATAKNQTMLRYTAAGFSCAGTAKGTGAGPPTDWRCLRGDAIVTFFSIGV